MKKQIKWPDLMTPIGAQQLIVDYRVDAAGRYDAVSGQPPQTQPGLSSPTAEMAEETTRRMEVRADRVLQEKGLIEAGLNSLPDRSLEKNAEQLEVDAINKVANVYATCTPAIRQKVKAERQSASELKAFRDARQITRDARYPLSKIKHIAVIVVCVLTEALANLPLFMNATRLGLLGGFGLSVLLAAINCSVACIVGLLPLRYFLGSKQ